jgi:hypothetical protein
MFNEEEIEKQLMDFDDHNLDTDVKINPNYYIHTGIMMAQKLLFIGVLKGNIKAAFEGYYILVEQLEVICKASKKLTDQYDKDLKAYLASAEYKANLENEIMVNGKLANKKLELIMCNIFMTTQTNAALKL